MKEQIKTILFAILDKEPERVTSEELEFLYQHADYNILLEYQNKTGQAIFIEGINAEPEEEVINISAMDLLNVMKYLEN